MTKLITENPNPKAKIGFFCYKPFHYFVYKNIYKHLKNAEFIIGDSTNPTIMQNSKELESYIMNKGIHWRLLKRNLDRHQEKVFYSKYNVLVSLWYSGGIMKEYNRDKKLVRVLYSNAGNLWSFGPWNAFFDLILTYGQYSQEYLQVYGNAKIVGNPRFDDLFTKSLDEEEIKKIKSQLHPQKKTILYSPTHGKLSSLPFLPEVLKKLSNSYNVVIQPHYNSFFTAKSVIKIYKENPTILIANPTEDKLSYLKVSDYVFVDNGSSVFDAILANKPVFFINILEKNFFNNTQKGIYYDNDKTNGLQTNKDSLEQLIKNSGNIGPVVDIVNKDPEMIYKMFVKVLSAYNTQKKEYEKNRKAIREKVFSYTDGTAGKKAAEEINMLLHKKKPSKNFLSESIITYLRNSSRAYVVENITNRYRTTETRNIIQLYSIVRSMPLHKRLLFLIKEFL